MYRLTWSTPVREYDRDFPTKVMAITSKALILSLHPEATDFRLWKSIPIPEAAAEKPIDND